MRRALIAAAIFLGLAVRMPARIGDVAFTNAAPATAAEAEMQAPSSTPPTSAPVSAPVASSTAPAAAPADSDSSVFPARLVIPSVGLDDAIVGVGINAKGEMDVPSGSTNNVGWYEYGTVPGNAGSAVLDAHVFAAFKNLKDVRPGADIYVLLSDGTKLHFVAEEAETYALADVPLETLFNRNDAARVNLITCAGNLTPDHSTYDHRLVVYARLAK